MRKTCGTLALFLGASLALAAYAPITTSPLVESSELSPEIVNELKDFLTLIPTATIDEVVAKHYILDGGFRRALHYVRSADFTLLLQKSQDIQEVGEILDFLHLRIGAASQSGEEPLWPWGSEFQVASVSVAAVPRLEFVLINGLPAQSVVRFDARVELEAVENALSYPTPPLGSFGTFVEELMEHLPRDKFTAMINAKRQKSAAFAEFYARLRSVQLRPMLEAALQSKNMTGVVQTLNSHDVYEKALLPIAFTVLSWGPPA